MLLIPVVSIRLPPIAGPTSLEILKLTEVSATTDGSWSLMTSRGASAILIGWLAEAIIPINKQNIANIRGDKKLKFDAKKSNREHKIIEQ